jgi:hypothetical protein
VVVVWVLVDGEAASGIVLVQDLVHVYGHFLILGRWVLVCR